MEGKQCALCHMLLILSVLDMLYAQSIILHLLWYTKSCVVLAEVLSQQLPDF